MLYLLANTAGYSKVGRNRFESSLVLPKQRDPQLHLNHILNSLDMYQYPAEQMPDHYPDFFKLIIAIVSYQDFKTP
jgi:hypothetical protein